MIKLSFYNLFTIIPILTKHFFYQLSNILNRVWFHFFLVCLMYLLIVRYYEKWSQKITSVYLLKVDLFIANSLIYEESIADNFYDFWITLKFNRNVCLFSSLISAIKHTKCTIILMITKKLEIWQLWDKLSINWDEKALGIIKPKLEKVWC